MRPRWLSGRPALDAGGGRFRPVSVDLQGVLLAETSGSGAVDLGRETGPSLLVLIRHRY